MGRKVGVARRARSVQWRSWISEDCGGVRPIQKYEENNPNNGSNMR